MQKKRPPKLNNFHVGSERDEEAEKFWENYPDMRPTPEDQMINREEQPDDQIQSEEGDGGGGGELPSDLYPRLIAWMGRGYDAWAALYGPQRINGKTYKGAGLNSDETIVTLLLVMKKMTYTEVVQIIGKPEYHVRKQVFMAKKKRKAMLERIDRITKNQQKKE